MTKILSMLVISALIFIGIPLAWMTDYLAVLFISNISPSLLLSALYLIPPVVVVPIVFHRAISVELRGKEFSFPRALLVGCAVVVFVVALAVVSKLTFPFFLKTL